MKCDFYKFRDEVYEFWKRFYTLQREFQLFKDHIEAQVGDSNGNIRLAKQFEQKVVEKVIEKVNEMMDNKLEKQFDQKLSILNTVCFLPAWIVR